MKAVPFACSRVENDLWCFTAMDAGGNGWRGFGGFIEPDVFDAFQPVVLDWLVGVFAVVTAHLESFRTRNTVRCLFHWMCVRRLLW